MKQLMTGNEAIARGVYEAGVKFASAYPGTPSTEILENIATYKEIDAEWANNEKVALEAVIGASLAGARSFASMKHVGLNVAADPIMTAAYIGVNGGMVLVTADEPGQHSSQNEQDNRNYAKFGKMPMYEPSTSQECKDMVIEAFELSEKYDTPVIIRMTTRLCHSKGVVECLDRKEVGIKEYVKDVKKNLAVPAHARVMRRNVEVRMQKLLQLSEETPLNRAEMNDTKIGIIASGMCINFAKEVFGKDASYLDLGFTNPLPEKLIVDFAAKVDKVYVVEENDKYIEDHVKALGITNIVKDALPPYGEMTPDVIRQSILGISREKVPYNKELVVPRPPSFCAGCPHRGAFYQLGKRKDIVIAGDIGCYALGFASPYNAMDYSYDMGSAISTAHGFQKVLNMKEGNTKRVVAVLGDSTFFHTGINSLIEVAYNKSNCITMILDNRITGMTGHQQNPGSGFTLQGEVTEQLDIQALVKDCGIKHIKIVNPNNLKEVEEALDWAIAIKDEPSVIITRWPCVLKKLSEQDIEEFDKPFKEKCVVDHDKCIGCKKCMKTGCPALSFNKEDKKVTIKATDCVGCEVCKQVCPKDAIVKEAK